MISVLAMHPLMNGISLCLYHVWVCSFCEGEKGRGREERTERERDRKGERKREKNSARTGKSKKAHLLWINISQLVVSIWKFRENII